MLTLTIEPVPLTFRTLSGPGLFSIPLKKNCQMKDLTPSVLSEEIAGVSESRLAIRSSNPTYTRHIKVLRLKNR